MATRLIIKSHHPWRHRAKLSFLSVLTVAVAWAVFEFGLSRAGYDNDSLLEEGTLLRQQLAEEVLSTSDLRARIAVLERAAQVDKQAYGSVETSQKQAQDEMLELKEEVAFYRGIVSPSETASGLNIPSFSVVDIGGDGAYRFKLVITQMKTNQRLVKGHAKVIFEGIKDGRQVQLSLKQVSAGALDKLKLRFKYFQNNEGEIVLPKGFLPSRVLVELVPTGKGAKRLKKTFDWSDIVK
ncbi:MAG: hypothetical protein COB30_015550 [Ectothiorhodospiraceae bacterium]|nr:hypothetical protein [Ectothiorhodospiraceae bacterium]